LYVQYVVGDIELNKKRFTIGLKTTNTGSISEIVNYWIYVLDHEVEKIEYIWFAISDPESKRSAWQKPTPAQERWPPQASNPTAGR